MNTIDPQTRHLLQHQARRMHYALHEEVPPNRKEAAAIQDRVDDILDRRPRPIAVTGDGDVLYDDATPWVLAQAAGDATLPPATFESFTPDLLPDAAKPAGTASGGVGLLEPPRPPDQKLSREAEEEIERFGRELGL